MLVFLDESGHPRPTDNNVFSCLAAICIEETDIRYLMKDIYVLKNTLFQNQSEKKASNILQKNTFLYPDKYSKRKQYVDAMIDLIDDYSAKVFSVIVERPTIDIITQDGRLPKYYIPIIKIVELYCENENKLKSLFIYDVQNEKEDERRTHAFTNFLYKLKLGRSFNKILEIPLFASSSITPGIQLADIVAAVIRLYYTHSLDRLSPKNDFEDWILSLFNSIKRSTVNIQERNTGFNHYGLYKMPKSVFENDQDGYLD